MAIETELKLHITPENLVRLKRHPFLRSLSSSRARTLKLYSIYYDTADLELHRRAMALRLRRVGKQFLQTLKGGGEVSAGLHQRNEWETPVPSEQLDFAVLKACGGELPHGVRNRLLPVFVTDFSRNVRLLNFEGAEIELCMDSGEIRAGQSSLPDLGAGTRTQIRRTAAIIQTRLGFARYRAAGCGTHQQSGIRLPAFLGNQTIGKQRKISDSEKVAVDRQHIAKPDRRVSVACAVQCTGRIAETG